MKESKEYYYFRIWAGAKYDLLSKSNLPLLLKNFSVNPLSPKWRLNIFKSVEFIFIYRIPLQIHLVLEVISVVILKYKDYTILILTLYKDK